MSFLHTPQPPTDLFLNEKVRGEKIGKSITSWNLIFKVQFSHPMRLRALVGKNYLSYILTSSGMV